MALVFKSESNDSTFVRENIKVGQHLARIYSVIDVGVQENKRFAKSQHKIVVGFEILDDVMSEGKFAGKPKTITQDFTVPAHPKSNTFIKLLNVLYPGISEEKAKAFDYADLIGKEIVLSIINELNRSKPGTFNDKIAGTAGVFPGVPVPKGVHEPLVFDLNDFTQKDLERVPKWIVKHKLPHLLSRISDDKPEI